MSRTAPPAAPASVPARRPSRRCSPPPPCGGRGEAGATAHQQGFALVMVLWVLSLMAVIAMAVAADGRSGVHVAQNRMSAAQARALAEGGVWWGVERLIGDPAAIRTDGTPCQIRLDDRVVEVSLQDEAGRIDLNKAPAELLEGLLRWAGASPSQARRLAGAIVAGRAEGAPAAAAFRAVGELRQLPGFDPRLFEAVAAWLTVHGTDGRINPMKAGLPVLLAVPGIDRRAAEAYLQARGEEPPAVLPPPPGAEPYVTGLSGRTVTIRSAARAEGGALYVQQATVELTAKGRQPFGIVAWSRAID